MAFISDKDDIFLSKLDDMFSLCMTRQKPVFSNFLSESKQVMAEKYFKQIHCDNFQFFGGVENCERKILCVFYDEQQEKVFPVVPIELKYRKCDTLTHRDFLGALMSYGIERDMVGDILVEDGRSMIFVKSEICDYIKSQIFKIGNVGVAVVEPNLEKIPKGRGTEAIDFIVSSLRLDNIVAAICGLSREKTSKLILSGNVSVNFNVLENVSYILKQNDVLIIKGKGKFTLDNIIGVTKKGRHKISVLHYK